MNPRTWPIVDLWRLMRPRGLVCVLLLPLIGYGWGHWDHALSVQGLQQLPALLLGWMCLHMGTMWLNAALDGDTGTVVFGGKAQLPPSIHRLSILALLVGVLFGFLAGWVPGFCALTSAVLGFCYSYPGFAWKGHQVGGPLVNLLGYGVLSPLAGWWIVGAEPTSRTLITWFVLILGIMATYYGLQGYQELEDRERGYKTLVATHGATMTLMVSRCLLWSAGLLLILFSIIGWYPRWILIGLPGFLWIDRWMSNWVRAKNAHEIQWARGFVRRSFIVGTALFGVVVGVYLFDSWAGEAVAGLATISGHP